MNSPLVTHVSHTSAKLWPYRPYKFMGNMKCISFALDVSLMKAPIAF